MKDKKLLQVVNLSPSESWVERLVEVHPMKQIFWASIIQACVFGFMLLSFLLISVGLKANDFDFEQMKEDGEKMKATEFRMDFNLENPKHKYFLAINVLDVATTVYAMENRNSLVESNLLLPSRPRPEELLIQKIIVISIAERFGLFSTRPETQHFINSLNVVTTLAVLNNIHRINTND